MEQFEQILDGLATWMEKQFAIEGQHSKCNTSRHMIVGTFTAKLNCSEEKHDLY
jgi:hypothetical protein